MVGMTMFLIFLSSGEWSASALPRPMVEPPPTETCSAVPGQCEDWEEGNARAGRQRGEARTQQSTFSSLALARASWVTFIGVCIVALV